MVRKLHQNIIDKTPIGIIYTGLVQTRTEGFTGAYHEHFTHTYGTNNNK